MVEAEADEDANKAKEEADAKAAADANLSELSADALPWLPPENTENKKKWGLKPMEQKRQLELKDNLMGVD